MGGSGPGYSYADVLEMDGWDAFRLVDRIADSREKESEAVRRASRSKGG
jgi:hypothetical protein